MSTHFDNETLAGANVSFQHAVESLSEEFGFDFAAIGLTSFVGAPLKWIYSAGATSERFRRIELAPGHGIGGIVLKLGKPMLFTDIDAEIDPREYSSYPIVFAEDLRSFCSLPLFREGTVVGALLLAFRTAAPEHADVYLNCQKHLDGHFCGLDVGADDFLNFTQIAAQAASARNEIFLGQSDLSNVIGAQEEERRRISRDLHDGVAQELLVVSMQLDGIKDVAASKEVADRIDRARSALSGVLDEIHNISVSLRPSTLDHLGLLPALRSQATVFERTYGARIVIGGDYDGRRFDPAIETQVYRIVTEAVLNACKYSGSDSVLVELDAGGGWMRAKVSDEGSGFDTAHPEVRGSGCGLTGMKERAAIIGATLDVQSNERGTIVTLVSAMPD